MVKERSLGAIFLSLIFILIIGLIKPENIDPQQADQAAFNRFWLEKTYAPAIYDMVVLGDSRVYRGISPVAMEEVLTGYRILNFGYSNAGFAPNLMQAARSKLNPRSRKQILVLGITPNSLTHDASENKLMQTLLEKSWDFRLRVIYLNPVVDFLSPFNLEDVQAAIQKDPQVQKGKLQQVFHSNGWVETRRERIDRSIVDEYLNSDVDHSIPPELVEGVYQQVREWHSEGIQVFGYRQASSLEMEAAEAVESNFDEQAFVEGFIQAGGIWLEYDRSLYQSYDGSHLMNDSASALSRTLAQLIKAELEKP